MTRAGLFLLFTLITKAIGDANSNNEPPINATCEEGRHGQCQYESNYCPTKCQSGVCVDPQMCCCVQNPITTTTHSSSMTSRSVTTSRFTTTITSSTHPTTTISPTTTLSTTTPSITTPSTPPTTTPTPTTPPATNTTSPSTPATTPTFSTPPKTTTFDWTSRITSLKSTSQQSKGSTTKSQASSDGLGGGAIAGIIIAVLVIIAGLAATFYFCRSSDVRIPLIGSRRSDAERGYTNPLTGNLRLQTADDEYDPF